MELFNFDVAKSIVKIRLAMTYEPAILKNDIKKRAYNALIFVLNGSYTYRFKGETLFAPRESLIYLPSGFENYQYTVTHGDSSRAKTMQIDFSVIDATTNEEISFSDAPILIEQRIPQIKEAMKSLISLHSSNNYAEIHLAYSELMRIISYVSTASTPENDSARKSILPAVKYIEQHYASKFSTNTLAKLCSLSESQFRRCFKSAIGKSPKAYQNELLLSSAKNLLRLGEFTVSEISEMLGFYDLYAFSHFFSKHSGTSPRRFCDEQKSK